jgi:hypothetical protein
LEVVSGLARSIDPDNSTTVVNMLKELNVNLGLTSTQHIIRDLDRTANDTLFGVCVFMEYSIWDDQAKMLKMRLFKGNGIFGRQSVPNLSYGVAQPAYLGDC